jgi:hypothetical protein
MLLVLPSCGIPKLRQAEPGPGLPLQCSFNGATSSENSAQLGIEEFYNDPMLTRLIDQALVGNRELKILAQEVQIANNEVLSAARGVPSLRHFRGRRGAEQIQRLHARRSPTMTDLSPRQVTFPIRCQISWLAQLLLATGHLEAVAECQGRGSAALHRRQ